MLAFIRNLLPSWASMATSTQREADYAAGRARYELFRALGHTHAAAMRLANGEEA